MDVDAQGRQGLIAGVVHKLQQIPACVFVDVVRWCTAVVVSVGTAEVT